ncbi:MAG TPA: phosphoadenosine phosphosulfate reductase family protein, partial [Candidatus Acidoferrum sp.]|nr:phosphoadenosine phosphosulfate reductase family protein [Candidatus Acidoferrum sp.]
MSTPESVLQWTYDTFPKVVIVASFQAESSVLIHLASQIVERPEVITLDTGRLPEETHAVMESFRDRFDIRLLVQTPDPAEVTELVGEHGPNPFYRSVELRRT